MDPDATSLNLVLDISASIENLTKDINKAVNDINTQFATISEKLNEELKSAFGLVDDNIKSINESIGITTDLMKSINIDKKSFEGVEEVFDSIIKYADKFAVELQDEASPLTRMLQLFTSINKTINAKNKALLLEAKYLKEEPEALKRIDRLFSDICDQAEDTLNFIGGANGWVNKGKEFADVVDRIAASFKSVNQLLKISNEENEKFTAIGYRKYGPPQEIRRDIINISNEYRILGKTAEEAFVAMAKMGGVPKKDMKELTGVVGQFMNVTHSSADAMATYVRQARLAGMSNADIERSLTQMAKAAGTAGLMGDDLNNIIKSTTVSQAQLQSVFGKDINYGQYVQMKAELAGVAQAAGLGSDALGNMIDRLVAGGKESAAFQALAGAGIDPASIKTAEDMAKALDQLSVLYRQTGGTGRDAIYIQEAYMQATGMQRHEVDALIMSQGNLANLHKDMTNGMKNVVGGLKEMNDQANDTTWKQLNLVLQKLTNILHEAGTVLDQTLAPALLFVLESVEAGIIVIKDNVKAFTDYIMSIGWVKDAMNALKNMSDDMKSSIKAVIGVVLVGGTAFLFINKIIPITRILFGGLSLASGVLRGALWLVGLAGNKAASGIGNAASKAGGSSGIFTGFFNAITDGLSKFAKAATTYARGIAMITFLLLGMGAAIYMVAQAMFVLSTIKNLGEVSATMAGIIAVLLGIIKIAPALAKGIEGSGRAFAYLAAFMVGAIGTLYAIVYVLDYMATVMEKMKNVIVGLFEALYKYDANKLIMITSAVAGLGSAMLGAAPGMFAFSVSMLALAVSTGALGYASNTYQPVINALYVTLLGMSLINDAAIMDLAAANFNLAMSIVGLGTASAVSLIPLAMFGGVLAAFSLAALIAAPIIDKLSMSILGLTVALEKFKAVSNINMKGSGVALMSTFAGGIQSATGYVISAISKAFSMVAKYLPHSNAELGPFSDLTGSGSALLETMAGGVLDSDALTEALSKQFNEASETPIKMPEIMTGTTQAMWKDLLSSVVNDNDNAMVTKANQVYPMPVFTDELKTLKPKEDAKLMKELSDASAAQTKILTEIYKFMIDADPKHLNKLDELIRGLRSGSNEIREFGNNTILNSWT